MHRRCMNCIFYESINLSEAKASFLFEYQPDNEQVQGIKGVEGILIYLPESLVFYLKTSFAVIKRDKDAGYGGKALLYLPFVRHGKREDRGEISAHRKDHAHRAKRKSLHFARRVYADEIKEIYKPHAPRSVIAGYQLRNSAKRQRREYNGQKVGRKTLL